MPKLNFERVPFPLVGGVETKVGELLLQPPKLLQAENCYFQKTGALRKRKGITTLPTATVDGGAIGTTPAAVALYKRNLLLMDAPSIGAGVYEYSETAQRWTEHATYAPGVLQTENLSASGGGQGVYYTDLDVCNGYTLIAETNEGPDDSGTFNTTLRVTLQDADGVFVCHRMQIFTNSTGASTLGAIVPRVVHIGLQFYVFFRDPANEDLRVWLLDTTSPATITAALNTSGGGSAAASIAVATTDFNQFFDVEASGANGVFLAYRTNVGNQIKYGFVNAAGVLASTGTMATAALAVQVAVAVQSTSRHGVGYITGSAAADIYAVHLSWSGTVWSTTATSGAMDTFAGSGTLTFAMRYDSATTLRLWYSADTTIGVNPNDTARFITYQTTYTTGGVISARVLRVRRSILMSRPFLAADGKLYYWNLVGRRNANTVQPTNFLVESATGLPVAVANYGVGSAGYPVQVVERNGAYVCAALYITRIIDGFASPVAQENIGVRALSWYLEHPQSHRCTEVGESLLMAGALPQAFDGVTFTELGFLRYVESDTLGLAQSAGGALTLLGKYYYRVVPESFNARGERQQGTDSGPLASFTLTGANNRITVTIPTLMMTRKRRTNSVVSSHQTARNDVVWAVYRTAANPLTTAAAFYRVGQVANSITANDVSFVDDVSDANLVDNEQLYLTSGEVNHSTPPAAHIMADGIGRVFLAGVTEMPHTVFFSLLRAPGDAVSFSNALQIPLPDQGGDITGMAVMNEALIVFKERAIYRIRGSGPDNVLGAGSFFDPELLTNDIGCQGQRSLVVTPFGVMFQAARGFFLLDPGGQVGYIGAPLEGLPSGADPAASIVTGATLLPMEQQVRFSADGVQWVYDYWHKQWFVYTDLGPKTPSVEWNGAHTWVDDDGVQLETEGLSAGVTMRILLALLKGGSGQDDLHVRRFAVSGDVTGTTANLQVRVFKDRELAAAQTASESGFPAGPLFFQKRTIDATRVVSTLKLEINDNGSPGDGILSLSEVIFEVATRAAGLSARVAR